MIVDNLQPLLSRYDEIYRTSHVRTVQDEALRLLVPCAKARDAVIAFVTAPLPSQREADEVAIINSTTTVIFSL